MLNTTKKTSRKGYTITEILVGITIFMILSAASVDFFVSSLEMQQKALISQRLLDNASYSLEYMGRALRMAKKHESPDICAFLEAKNYELTTRGQGGIKFLNYDNQCLEFYLNNIPNSSNNFNLMVFDYANNKEYPLTPDYLNVISFKITLSGDNVVKDDLQPKVTLFLEVQGKQSKKPELQPKIKIQTTVSQRNLDI